MSDFKECNWKKFNGDMSEDASSYAPEPGSEDLDLQMYVDVAMLRISCRGIQELDLSSL